MRSIFEALIYGARFSGSAKYPSPSTQAANKIEEKGRNTDLAAQSQIHIDSAAQFNRFDNCHADEMISYPLWSDKMDFEYGSMDLINECRDCTKEMAVIHRDVTIPT